ncbi:MAG TPA: riboflavin synthase [Gemmatimonadaceae bacterium]|nr:riboflavin synthase [Gemmatimonadaceae bacterium]
MFSGLVDSIGTVETEADTPAGRELRIACDYPDLTDGESVAVNGACLTVRAHGPGWFTVAAIGPTRDRTTVGSWAPGTRVNLERALRMGDRLGGHMVLGHVDGVAQVTAVERAGDARLLDLALPPGLGDLMVPHGSLALDGVSLTVNAILAGDAVQVSLIEYTLRHTTLGALHAGSLAHVEADLIGKYVQRVTLASRVLA